MELSIGFKYAQSKRMSSESLVFPTGRVREVQDGATWSVKIAFSP